MMINLIIFFFIIVNKLILRIFIVFIIYNNPLNVIARLKKRILVDGQTKLKKQQQQIQSTLVSLKFKGILKYYAFSSV